MDTSFDLVALLRQQPTTKSHKIRPSQFVSVAGGVQKRLETNIKYRKSSRLSVFDSIRNIAKCESPKAPPLSETQQKGLYRKQQLEKWKEDKDKKKKEAAAQKKKPFVAGMSQRRTFGPPPPPRPMPNTSGRVTRSQARQKIEPKPSNTQTKSFAPSNATFKPPILKTEVPKLAPVNRKKAGKSKTNITFEPVLMNNLQKETRPTTRTTRAKPVANIPVVEQASKPESMSSKTRKPNDKTKVNAKTTKTTSQKPPPLKQQMFQISSSSSETEQPKHRKKPSLRKPEPPQESTSQDSACVLQDASISSPDTISMTSQDNASISSQDAFTQDNATVIQHIGTTSLSQDDFSTPRKNVPRSESSSEEKLRSPKPVGPLTLTPEQIIQEAKQISPCVTMSRGKDNARKEMKKKLDEGLLDEDNSNMDSVNHFRRQLDSEIARISATCDTWDQIFAQTALPESVQELVLTAVGQARLLMSKKLQQFAGLIDSCARPAAGPAGPAVTPADLHGFWDMVFMQVENVEMRFKTLEELRVRNWVEEQKPVAKKVVAKPVVKKVAVKPSGGPSRLREMIAAARKAKKNQDSQSENSESDKSGPTASPDTKTFEAGFFRVSSPLKRSPAPGTPGGTPSNKASLLKSVLSSEAKKSVSKRAASFAILRASLMSKNNVDIEGVSPLMQTPTVTPVNLYATPARSILKLNPVSTQKAAKAKTVLFHETDEPSSPTSYTSCELESGVVPLLADDKENKDTPREEATLRRSRLSRQNAEEQPSPVKTRSRRKSAQTPLVEADANVEVKRRSTRKPKVQSAQETETPKRSSQRRKSAVAGVQTPLVEAEANLEVKKRSTRKPKVQSAQETETPQRSSRRRKSVAAV